MRAAAGSIGIALFIFLLASASGATVPDNQLPPRDDGGEEEADPRSDESGGEVEVVSTGTEPGSPGEDGTPGESYWEELWDRYCTYTSNYSATGDYSFSAGARVRLIWIEQSDVEALRSFYRADCIRADGSAYDGGIFDLPDGSGVGAVDPTILRARAFARINIEPPGIETNPSFTDRNAVVRIPTWLWVTDSWDDRIETDADGGLTVSVIASPTGVLWEFTEPVDDNTILCEDEPVPWTPGADDTTSNCSYTFVSSSAGVGASDAFEGSATISWEFSWTLDGVDQGAFAVVEGITPFAIQVGEIQAVGTPNA